MSSTNPERKSSSIEMLSSRSNSVWMGSDLGKKKLLWTSIKCSCKSSCEFDGKDWQRKQKTGFDSILGNFVIFKGDVKYNNREISNHSKLLNLNLIKLKVWFVKLE